MYMKFCTNKATHYSRNPFEVLLSRCVKRHEGREEGAERPHTLASITTVLTHTVHSKIYAYLHGSLVLLSLSNMQLWTVLPNDHFCLLYNT